MAPAAPLPPVPPQTAAGPASTDSTEQVEQAGQAGQAGQAAVRDAAPPVPVQVDDPPALAATRMGRKREHRRRRARIAAVVGIGALVIAATAVGGTVAAMAKTVTISVDGATQQVSTLSGTVDGALSAAGVAVGAHDTLAPAGGSSISDGSRIVVQRGRLVTLTVDGAQRRFWTTATTVDAALAQIGRNPSDYRLSADRSRPIPLGGLDLTATTLHTVTVTDPQGAAAHVTTAAATVGDLLRDQGLDLAPDQAVSPSPSTPLTDGLTVTVRTLPTITLVRGADRSQVTSGASTIGGLLADQGVVLSDVTVVSPAVSSALTPGLVVTVTQLPVVTVTDGAHASVTVIAHQKTVAALLAARKINLGAHDTVSPGAGTALSDGMAVTVRRVSYSTTTKDVAIPQPPDRTEYSASLDQGVTQIVPGHPGTERITYQITTVNGKAGAPKETSRTTVVQAVATVTIVGTRAPATSATAAPSSTAAKTVTSTKSAPPTTSASSPGVQWVGNQVFFHDNSYGVNWDGLAHCESTNNPRAVNPTGRYFGLFQFDLPTWRSVGGSGNPIDATPQEQLLRAQKLYLSRGLSPWACAWAAH
jgi:uncharacterized protein YabE (DUF348 family)